MNPSYDDFTTELGVDDFILFDFKMYMATTSSTGDPMSFDVTFKSVAS